MVRVIAKTMAKNDFEKDNHELFKNWTFGKTNQNVR